MKTAINTKILFSLLTLLVTNSSFAAHRGRCVHEYFTKISEESKLSNTCNLAEPLSLSWTTQTYPLLRDNPRRVQYWQGAYSRSVVTTTTYLRELIDECRGYIISQNQISKPVSFNVNFSIVNPNLDPNISESYMLVPMTTPEAQQELTQANKNCQNYSLP